jgi:hypothetical protein
LCAGNHEGEVILVPRTAGEKLSGQKDCIGNNYIIILSIYF